jgi:spermidine synthase
MILIYGAWTLVAQVLVLRELLVLAQGQELKLALGLWCWLGWTGLGSLLGGRLSRSEATTAILAAHLNFLGLLLPVTILAARALPSLGIWPPGQTLPPLAAMVIFLGLVAPLGLISGHFFPRACQFLAARGPGESAGRVYYLETLGAALGVAVLQLLLFGRVPHLFLSLGAGLLVSLAAWGLSRPAGIIPRLGFGLNILLLGIALLFTPQLEAVSRQWQWPGRQVAAAVDSPYALLTATREAEQYSFFANNLWYFTYPDPLTAEHQVQWALLQHPRPRRVLLLGGGAAGLAPEILKTPGITRLDYLEADPQLVELAQELLGAAPGLKDDPRLRLIFQDPRRFLARTGERYDVILMALPEPVSAQLNRYYTREFFQLAANLLESRGVLSFSLPGAAASLPPLRAAYLAVSLHTLNQVFPQVLAFPGERVRFFASVTPGTLIADPKELAVRLQERGINLTYVREYYFLFDLSLSRLQYLEQVLRQHPHEVNTDLNPRCYFYDLALSSQREGLPLQDLWLGLSRLPGYFPWVGGGLVGLLAAVLCRRRPGSRYLYQVLVMGLGAMALELAVLILYQIYQGYLYRQMGVLFAAFMAGMGAGAAWAHLVAPRDRYLAGLQGGLAGLAALLGLVLPKLSGAVFPEWGGLLLAAHAAILILAGAAGGGIFALSAVLWAKAAPDGQGQGGVLYAADLLGATLGVLGVGLIILPVWGLLPVLYLAAALHAGAALMALTPGKS